jgi:hypothetical protein
MLFCRKNISFLSVFLIFISHASRADELLITVFRPLVPMDWSTPRKALTTYVENEFNRQPLLDEHHLPHNIGHMGLRVDCEAGDGLEEYVRATGESMVTNSDYQQLIFKKKVGLGTLLESVRGRLYTTEEANADFLDYTGSKRFAILRYQISSQTCRRVQKFIEEFDQKKVYENYGSFSARPRYAEGAGCSSFGVAVLEVAGLLDADQSKTWRAKVRVPKTLVGGSLNPKNPMSLLDVLWSKDSKAWATPEQAGYDISIWDPELMYRWIESKYKNDPTLQKIAVGDSIGLKINATERPTPTDTLWFTSSVPNSAFATANQNLSVKNSAE